MVGRRAAGVRHRAKRTLWSYSWILCMSMALVSLQGPKVLGRVWEKKDTQLDDTARGRPCGQAGSLQRETLQMTTQEQGACGQAALPAQPSISSFLLGFNYLSHPGPCQHRLPRSPGARLLMCGRRPASPSPSPTPTTA